MYIFNLREFVNYRHPGPRRVWKVGSELQSTTLDPVDLSGSKRRVPKCGFVYAKPYFSLSGRPPTSPGPPATPQKYKLVHLTP